MRKNKMMRAASALLVAVLLTTSTISGTFAKYVTTATANDEARVAKWGVELQVVGNLFGDTYANVSNGNKITANDDDTATVRSYNTTDGLDGDDVVAPGTKNDEGFSFSINGTPEVSGEISIDKLEIQNIFLASGTYGVMIPVEAGVITSENYTEFFDDGRKLYHSADEANFIEVFAADPFKNTGSYYTLENRAELAENYFPVKFNLDGTTTKYAAPLGTTTDTLKEVANRIAGQINTYTSSYAAGITTYTLNDVKTFAPNTNLASVGLEDEMITWEWAFEGQSDEADTILGMLIAKRINAIDPDPDVDNFYVVKLKDGAFIELIEFTDYCLDIKFDIEFTVTQVN